MGKGGLRRRRKRPITEPHSPSVAQEKAKASPLEIGPLMNSLNSAHCASWPRRPVAPLPLYYPLILRSSNNSILDLASAQWHRGTAERASTSFGADSVPRSRGVRVLLGQPPKTVLDCRFPASLMAQR